jgi:hypothetical protein
MFDLTGNARKRHEINLTSSIKPQTSPELSGEELAVQFW